MFLNTQRLTLPTERTMNDCKTVEIVFQCLCELPQCCLNVLEVMSRMHESCESSAENAGGLVSGFTTDQSHGPSAFIQGPAEPSRAQQSRAEQKRDPHSHNYPQLLTLFAKCKPSHTANFVQTKLTHFSLSPTQKCQHLHFSLSVFFSLSLTHTHTHTHTHSDFLALRKH